MKQHLKFTIQTHRHLTKIDRLYCPEYSAIFSPYKRVKSGLFLDVYVQTFKQELASRTIK